MRDREKLEKIKEIVESRSDEDWRYKLQSFARMMGNRPSEERIRETLHEIIDTYKIAYIDLNINRDTIGVYHYGKYDE